MSRYPVTPIKVQDVVTDLAIESARNVDVFVSGVTQDSREVQPGDFYCCVSGEYFDGHTFASDAIAAGAVALLVDRDIENIPDDIAIIRVKNVREILGYVAHKVFGEPSTSLTIVGITGTNGKTSTTAMLSAILSHAGFSVHTMGTLTGVRTTPEAIDLHAVFRQCVIDGISHVVMEVSSHALALYRVAGVMFDLAVLTNVGRDHLDFHGTEEAYFAAKAKLFDPRQSRRGVVNIDDARGQLLFDVQPIEMTTFSMGDVSDMAVEVDRVRFVWRNEVVEVPLGGIFTVMNALAALTAATEMGVANKVAARGLTNLSPITGRFESVPNSVGIGVIVDYAHTPEGLTVLLETTRTLTHERVIVVFGCGGDRDQGKRPLMGKVASELADVVVVTSDNPRGENADGIIDEILVGITRGQHAEIFREVDRSQAITSAISMAKHGDIVVLAGKGHELTQEVGGVQFPFSDMEMAREALRQREQEATQ
jgi:UDP-N-acetylmuramoyl-L-alanyl-D-glutamate--2,6-diaminopimelate ligase